MTYNGSTTMPSNAGNYAVVATVNDPNFVGQVSGNLIVSKADQQISSTLWQTKRSVTRTLANSTASSSLPVAFSADGNCTVTGSQVH